MRASLDSAHSAVHFYVTAWRVFMRCVSANFPLLVNNQRGNKLETSPLARYIAVTNGALRGLAIRLFTSNPDSFVCASAWKLHATTIKSIIHAAQARSIGSTQMKFLSDMAHNIASRNDALIFQNTRKKTSSFRKMAKYTQVKHFK